MIINESHNIPTYSRLMRPYPPFASSIPPLLPSRASSNDIPPFFTRKAPGGKAFCKKAEFEPIFLSPRALPTIPFVTKSSNLLEFLLPPIFLSMKRGEILRDYGMWIADCGLPSRRLATGDSQICNPKSEMVLSVPKGAPKTPPIPRRPCPSRLPGPAAFALPSPEGAPYHSPGQRPETRDSPIIEALKERDNAMPRTPGGTLRRLTG